MRYYTRPALLAFLLVCSTLAFAQTERNCSTMENLEMLKAQDPAVEDRMRDLERFTQTIIQNQEEETGARMVYTIPVVVHVVYRTSAENISDAQIQSQIDVLNGKRGAPHDGDLIQTDFIGDQAIALVNLASQHEMVDDLEFAGTDVL